MLNFAKIGQSVAKIKIFLFFKMAAAAILDCRIHKILLADSGRRAQMHHFTKFCQNRSIRCRDIAIFRIFKKLALGSRRISMPNFVKIGQSVAKILRVSIFQDGGHRHIGFSKS